MASPQQTVSHMRFLKLPAIADAYQSQLQQPRSFELSFDDRIGMLFDAEMNARSNNRVKRLMKSAGFPEFAALEEIDWREDRALDRRLIESLATCEWVKNNQNIIVLGATGVGKTWLASALGAEVCRKGMSVLSRRCVELYAQIARAITDGSLPKLKIRLSQVKVLMLDDIGLGELSLPVANALWEVIDRRLRRGSLILTSQFPIDDWHRFIPDPTLADAILDRIIHQSYKIQLKGESLRKIYGKRKMGEH